MPPAYSQTVRGPATGRVALPLCSRSPYPASHVSSALVEASRPRSRHVHWQTVGDYHQLFVVNGSQVFKVDGEILEQLGAAAQRGDRAVEQLLAELEIRTTPLIDDSPLVSPPLYALSLAIAQKCNLGCTYCYAGQGDFGGPARNMTWEIAQRAVVHLIDSAEPGAQLNLAFLGGEPLLNRSVLQAATEFAAGRARARGVRIGFSLTTNGTLLTEADAEFFERHGFAVTISLDGLREAHDRQRPFKQGGGSFDRILDRAAPLLARQRQMQVSVRATVTPGPLRLREALDFFLARGFHSVGFSPVLRSPDEREEFAGEELIDLLEAMIDCGLECERHLLRGERYAFVNLLNALREIHRGTHRPYPCGAGVGYLGVSADGQLAACHRFVGDRDGGMGNLTSGIDREAQNRWLAERHVHTQSPCGNCWARYLCSGGCHHEVLARGRTACDYIRGWLHYCLQAYARITQLRPDWFASTQGPSSRDRDGHGKGAV